MFWRRARPRSWTWWTVLALSITLRAQEPTLAAAEALIQQERLPEAEQVLQVLLKRQPDTEVAFRLGYVQFRRRNLSAARQQLTEIVRSAPPAYHSRYFLGRIALLQNRAAEAAQWLEPVVASRETVQDAAAQLATAYQATGQRGRAIEALGLAIRQTPWDGALYYRLGRLRQQLGQAEMARDALATGARLKRASAADVETLMQLSEEVRLGHLVQAVNLGRGILAKPEVDPAALVALGMVWVKAELTDEAIDVFQQATRRDPAHFPAQFNLGLALLRSSRAADAMQPLARAVQLLPQSSEAQLTLGLAAVMTQHYADARPALEAARRLDPSNQRVAALLATAYVRTGAAAAAVKLLRESGATTMADSAGALMLVEALNSSGQTEAAVEAARQAIGRFPEQATAHMALAQQLARAGRYEEARPVFLRVLALEPGQPEAALGLGDAMQRGGDHAAALEAYRPALLYRSTTLAARLGSARSLVALRRLDDARKLLEEGLAGYSSASALRLELSRVYARLGLTVMAEREAEEVHRLKAGESKP